MVSSPVGPFTSVGPKESDMGKIRHSEGVMNDRFVAVSIRIRGLRYVAALLSRDAISVSRGRWQPAMNAMQLDGLSNSRKKSRQSLSHISERNGSSAYCNATSGQDYIVLTSF